MRTAALLLAAQALIAQQGPGLSYQDFQTWMKATAVPGYKFMGCEQDGLEFTASFMGATPEKVLMVRCGSLASFNDVTRMAGAVQGLKTATHQGLRTHTYAMANMPMLQVEWPAKRTTLTLGGSEGMPAGELQKLLTALDSVKRSK